MENEYYREIMDSLKELSVNQATLHERVDSHLKQSERLEDSVKKLETSTLKIERHDMFMRASIWIYALAISTFGVKFFMGDK